MKENKTIPIWPLYLGDFLMLAAVLYVTITQPLSNIQTGILAFLVLIAMFVVVLPYVLQNKLQISIAKIGAKDDSAKIDEQFAAVFSDLRTLRAKLAEQAETIQINAAKFNSAAGDNSELIEKIDSLSESVENLKIEIAEAREQSGAPAEIGAETEERIVAIEVIAHSIKHEIENLKNSVAEIETAFEDSTDIEDEYVEDEEEFEEETSDAEEDTDVLEEESFEENEAPKSMEEQACEKSVDETACEVPDNSDDGYEEPLPYGDVSVQEKPKQAKNWEGLIDKALSNSQSSSTRDTVSRFIEKNKAGEAPATEEGVEEPLEAKSSDTETAEEIQEPEIESEIHENESEEKPQAVAQASLFEEEQFPKKEKAKPAKSGDTALIANAFPGIGNKLYIRGNGGGLSQDKGQPMQMTEIGKWQWKCEAMLGAEISVSIWLNDETPSKAGEFILNPNETITLDILF